MIKLMGVHYVFGLLILSASLEKLHGYVLSPEENFNVWDAEEDNQNSEALKLLAYLCENYQVSLNNANIDCSSIQLGIKDLSWDDDYHVIRKREASDTDLEEGSGNENEPEISLYNKESSNTTKLEDVKEFDPESVPQPEGELAVANADPQPISDNTEDKSAIDEHESASNVEEPTSSNNTEQQNENVQETAAVREPLVPVLFHDPENNKEGETEDSQPAENKEAVVSESTPNQIGNAEASSEHEIPRSETTVVPPVQYSVEVSNAEPVQYSVEVSSAGASSEHEIPRSETTVMPSVQYSVEGSSAGQDVTTQRPKESEAVDDQQSGNAIVIKEPKILAPVLIEGSESDKALSGEAPKANVKSRVPDSEQPNAGESATNVTKAGKDTTILIVLFVVVIVIGAAAFTHNFIKKRKQKNSENEVGNGIRRSLQNLTGNGKNTGDVEQGTEMKPLMKSNPNDPVIVKEFSDTKKESEAS